MQHGEQVELSHIQPRGLQLGPRLSTTSKQQQFTSLEFQLRTAEHGSWSATAFMKGLVLIALHSGNPQFQPMDGTALSATVSRPALLIILDRNQEGSGFIHFAALLGTSIGDLDCCFAYLGSQPQSGRPQGPSTSLMTGLPCHCYAQICH